MIVEPDIFTEIFDNHRTHEHSKFYLKREFLRLVNDIIKRNNLECITVLQGSKITILVKCKKRELSDLVIDDFTTILKNETRSYFGSSITIAIGRVVNEIKEIKSSYHEASDVFTYLRSANMRGKCMHFKELGFCELFLNKSFIGFSEGFAKFFLKSLIQSDIAGTAYLSTLESYFYNNCRIQQTADDLYIHPNTLRYRLERIKEISGFDFQSGEDRLNAHLAIKVLSYKMPELFQKK